MQPFSALPAVAALFASLLLPAWPIFAQLPESAASEPPSAETPPADEQESVTLQDSPLVKQPQTPAETFDAALFMLKLDRPKLARLYLEQFLNSQPDEALLLELHDKYGQDAFLRLVNTKELKPLATGLLDRVNEAVRKRAADERRTDQLLALLRGPAPQRERALRALQTAGVAAVPRIIQRFVTTPEERDTLLYALIQMGQAAVPPLLGALDAPDPNVRAAVIEALGRLRAADAATWLWYPAFGPDQPAGVQAAAREALMRIFSSKEQKVERVSSFGVAKKLMQAALIHYRGQYDWRPDEQGLVSLWNWQPDIGTVRAVRLSPEKASLYVGVRFARQAMTLSPEDADLRALYLGLLLALDRQQVGWSAPLPTGPGTAHDLALTLGAKPVSLTLAQALSYGRADAAEAALRVLSQVGTRGQLKKTRPEQAPVLAALDYPDPRVQFAAAVAILEFDPVEPFRGSRRVVQILERALNGDTAPVVVVTHANAERARTIGSFAGQMGFDPVVATTGQQAFRLAAERSDVELILLDVNTIRWPLSQTLANLRADARTASIPIVVYGPIEKRGEIERVLDRHKMTAYIVEPAEAGAFKTQVEPFLQTLKSPRLSPQERGARRQSAAFWLAHIAAGRRTDVFDIEPAEDSLIRAIGDADLAANALQALGAIPSREAQSMMAQIALDENYEAGFREDAAVGLAFHIQRFGLLLTEQEVDALKTAWRSASAPSLATALASVVGSFGPGPAEVHRRLSQFPVPTPGSGPSAPTSSAPSSKTPESPPQAP